MKIVPLCALLTFALIATLAHAVILDSRIAKTIEILYLPRFIFADQDLGFLARIHAIDTDRAEWAILCNLDDLEPCTTEHNERVSMVSIEGSAAPVQWRPRPWQHVSAGSYAVVVAIGPVGSIRASQSLTVEVRGI